MLTSDGNHAGHQPYLMKEHSDFENITWKGKIIMNKHLIGAEERRSTVFVK